MIWLQGTFDPLFSAFTSSFLSLKLRPLLTSFAASLSDRGRPAWPAFVPGLHIGGPVEHQKDSESFRESPHSLRELVRPWPNFFPCPTLFSDHLSPLAYWACSPAGPDHRLHIQIPASQHISITADNHSLSLIFSSSARCVFFLNLKKLLQPQRRNTETPRKLTNKYKYIVKHEPIRPCWIIPLWTSESQRIFQRYLTPWLVHYVPSTGHICGIGL